MAKKTLMDEAREELTKDRELNQLYQRELAKLKVANQILAARQHAGLSQAALAKLIGTQQSGVARMENAGCTSYTTSTLAKIAAATGSRLEVRIVPAGSRRPALTTKTG
jgi:ribosome-binding protein aMBF1 (putative translation factor)